MSTSTALAPAPSRELRAPGRWRRLWQWLMPPASVDVDQLNRQLAVLEGARAELEVGWVQGSWLAVGTRDSGPVRGGPVQGVCLVGALLRAGPGAGRAVDAVYDALWAARGQVDLPGPRPVPSPEVRQARVRTLTNWNDQPGRTQADVLALVDQAISATIMDLVSAPRPASPPEPATKLRA